MTVVTDADTGRSGGVGDAEDADAPRPVGGASDRDLRWWVARIALGLVAAGLIIWSFFEEKIRSTLITVVIAVGASGALWIGANLLFNQVRHHWARFNLIVYSIVGFVAGVVLHGNLITVGSGEGFFTWIVGPLVGALVLGGLGYLLSVTDDPGRRRTIALGGAAVIGVVLGLLIRDTYHPEFDALAIVGYTALGAGIGAGLSSLRKRPPIQGTLTGGAIGWVLGAWGGAELGGGTVATSIIATLVPALAIGARIAMTSNPDYRGRVDIDLKSRAVIFVGPALLFIAISLVIPAIRTLYLSVLDRSSDGFVGLENYGAIFTSRTSFDG